MRKTADGMDGPVGESRCANLWTVYQQMRGAPSTHAERRAALTAGGTSASSECSFGAPLVGRALQRLGVLDDRVDVSLLTPASFMNATLLPPPASFGRVGIR